MSNNPFAVKTPEKLSDEDIAHLFVDVFTDFPSILGPHHTFIHGARGCGKSMMLRYLEPNVQLIERKAPTINQLPFYAIHIPIRTANLNVIEFNRLQESKYWAIAEHFLVLYISGKILNSLNNLANKFDISSDTEKIRNLFDEFFNRLRLAGWPGEIPNSAEKSTNDLLKILHKSIDTEFQIIGQYLRRLSLGDGTIPYDGAICDYLSFLYPLCKEIQQLDFLPSGPLFLLLDDADNLHEKMQRILNTWVSFRTTETICLKITTQLKYKTYRTTNGQLIECPHDYSDIDISTKYTNDLSTYYKRVEMIVQKRLARFDIQNISVYDYFPTDSAQEEGIKLIAEELKKRWHTDNSGPKGYRPSDDVTRYAKAEYIRRLGGSSKNSATYSYAGFGSLVDISSGIIRCFLEPAARMYSTCISQAQVTPRAIPTKIQDEVMRQWSEEFLLNEFEKVKLSEDSEEQAAATGQRDPQNYYDQSQIPNKLYNLINALGEAFQTRLLDQNASERRLISILLSSPPSPDLESVLRLGVEYGYLQASTLGSKEGIGRRKQYILNRRLAPYFRLDPGGYAAYLSVTPDDLVLACTNPRLFVLKRLKPKKESSTVAGNEHPSLFSGE